MEFFENIFDIVMTKKIFGTLIVILVAYILIKAFNGAISKILITGKTPYEVKKKKNYC